MAGAADRWQAMLWEHLTPMITRSADECGRKFPGGPVTYPRDCVEVLRCRPFRFVHKVVDRWFHQRTMLIGDAAHVFPPFAGQGIASGVRDAHQLAWRLALLVRANAAGETGSAESDGKQHLQQEPEAGLSLSDRILNAWALERRKSVDDAALLSKQNGQLVNEAQSPAMLLALFLLRLANLLLSYLPRSNVSRALAFADPQARHEQEGFAPVAGGFFVGGCGGSAKLAQIWIESARRAPMLSDRLLHRPGPLFTLLVVAADVSDAHDACRGARKAVAAAGLNPSVFSNDSIVVFSPTPGSSTWEWNAGEFEVYAPLAPERLPGEVRFHEYRWFMERLGRGTRHAIVRPDSFVLRALKDCTISASVWWL